MNKTTNGIHISIDLEEIQKHVKLMDNIVANLEPLFPGIKEVHLRNKEKSNEIKRKNYRRRKNSK